MDILEPKQEKKGTNWILIGGVIAALVVIGGIVAVLSMQPSMDDQRAKMLEGALREGTPGFDELNKKIYIATDENTVESPTGLGTITMFIRGNVSNKTPKTIKLLEINVAVINQQNQPIKSRDIIAVPTQQPEIPPDGSIPVTLTMDGFDRKDDRANIRWKVTAIKAE